MVVIYNSSMPSYGEKSVLPCHSWKFQRGYVSDAAGAIVGPGDPFKKCSISRNAQQQLPSILLRSLLS